MSDTPDWEEIRRAQCDHSLSIPKLLLKYDITLAQFRARKKLENWPNRPSIIRRRVDVTAGASGPVGPAVAATTCPPPIALGETELLVGRGAPKAISAAGRRALIRRIYAAIDTKLKVLERRFEHEMAGLDQGTADAVSAADNERDTRAIGTLIKNLEHVTAYDATNDLARPIHGAAAKSASLAATALADEADRIRRDLAERLQRFIDTPKPGS